MDTKNIILTAAGTIVVSLVSWLSSNVISLGNRIIKLESEATELNQELSDIKLHLANFEADLIEEVLNSNTIDDLIDSAHYHTGKGLNIKTHKKKID